MTSRKIRTVSEIIIAVGVIAAIVLLFLGSYLTPMKFTPNKGETRIAQKIIIQSYSKSCTIKTSLQYLDEQWHTVYTWSDDIDWNKITATKNLQRMRAEDKQKYLKIALKEFYNH